MKGGEVNLGPGQVLNHGNACNQILRCLQRHVAGEAATVGSGGRGAAVEKGEALQLIWSHTMKDALASKGALCKQGSWPLTGIQVISTASIN